MRNAKQRNKAIGRLSNVSNQGRGEDRPKRKRKSGPAAAAAAAASDSDSEEDPEVELHRAAFIRGDVDVEIGEVE